MPKHITLALTALLTLLLLSPPVQAGTYTVYSCRTPSGRWVGSEGWSRAVASPTQDFDTGAALLCPASDPKLQLRFGDSQLPVEEGTAVELTFAAPLSTSIASATIIRSFVVDWPIVEGIYERPYIYDAWHDEDEWERHISPLGVRASSEPTDSTLSVRDQRWTSVRLRLTCWSLFGALDCGPGRASVTVPRAEIQLTDTGLPWVASLCCDARVRGTLDLGFTAQDLQSGVYRSRFEIDGRVVEERIVDSNQGACTDAEPSNSNPYEFSSPEPCIANLDGQILYDTRGLRDGPHSWRLSVEDAAGNRSAVIDRTVVFHNAPIPVEDPSIAGVERLGQALRANTGLWDGDVAAYGYRWLRCDRDGGGCGAILGADGAEYRAGAEDVYHRLVVEVTAGNGSGSAVARSAASEVIADADGNTSPAGPAGGGDPRPGDGGGTGGRGGDGDGAGGGEAGGRSAGTGGGVAGIPSLQNPLGEQPGRAPNGSGATAKARVTLGIRRAGGGTVRRALGARTRRWKLTGRVVNASGKPIGGAKVNLVQRIGSRRWVARKGLVRTRADGRFSATLPGGPSRTVRATYFPFGDSDAFRASNSVAIDVLAPLTISTDRRVVAGRRVVTIRGAAGGGSIPRGGLLVTLQGFQAGFGWRTFRTLRTDARGRWHASYRFRATSGRFAFRALVPRQGTYPYATTVSRPVAVTVR